MLAAALAENPPQQGRDPDLRPRRPRGVLADATSRGASVITRPVDPWAAIARAERVYAAGGETGFLALLAGRAVRCFDDSFYSGWGVTADDARVAQRLFRRTVDQIFAGACLVATRYLDPYRKTASTFEQILSILAEWRKIESANRRVAVLVGMSFWKRRRVAEFFRSTVGTPTFRRTTKGALKRGGRRLGRGRRCLGLAHPRRARRGGRAAKDRADPRRRRVRAFGWSRLRFRAGRILGARQRRHVL